MTTKVAASALTGSLEDYLETVYLLVQKFQFARVRDIADARGVASASVTPALKRLAELGLVDYAKREYVRLTQEGERLALRVLSRHQILRRFFADFLQMPADLAEQEACAMEHSLSDTGMDRLVRFAEFVTVCPVGFAELFTRFHGCARVQHGSAECGAHCSAGSGRRTAGGDPMESLSNLKPGNAARVAQVNAVGPIRQRLLDMGLLPGVLV